MNVIESAKAAGWTDTAISMASEQEMQRMERFAQIIRNQALEDAAKCCDVRYSIRSHQGLPREASSARSLSESIRSMKKDQTNG